MGLLLNTFGAALGAGGLTTQGEAPACGFQLRVQILQLCVRISTHCAMCARRRRHHR
jgi:hypothetical protein